MNVAAATSTSQELKPARSSALLGFGAFFRKELRWWWSDRAALIVLAVATVLGGLSLLGNRLALLIAASTGESIPAGEINLDPTANVLNAQWDQWLIFITIFVSMGLLTAERDRGTLAWSLSKPLSRTALLLAKWTAAVIMLGIFGIALPMAVGTAIAPLAYGTLPDVGSVATLALLLLSVPAFFVALSLALGTRVHAQAGIAGISIGIAAVPLIVGSLLPDVAQVWPTSIGAWSSAVAGGLPITLGPPIAWLASMPILIVIGVLSFWREDM